MTLKNTEKVINESLNNIVIQFIHEIQNDIFINNKIFIIFNIIIYF